MAAIRLVSLTAGPDHGEVEPVDAADVAVEHLADVQAEIEAGHRQARGLAPLVQHGHAAVRVGRGVERAGAGVGGAAASKIARMPSPMNFSTSPPWPSIAVTSASA